MFIIIFVIVLTLIFCAIMKTKLTNVNLSPNKSQIEMNGDKMEINGDVMNPLLDNLSNRMSGDQKQHVQTKEETTVSNPRDKDKKVVALDCEMVGIRNDTKSMLARVSIVNIDGQLLYDKYVLPQYPVFNYRTPITGITKKDLNKGERFCDVQNAVKNIIKNKILVGHALDNDFRVLCLTHPVADTRDISTYRPFMHMYNRRSLKSLAEQYLKITIQQGKHDPIQDAIAAMNLYKLVREEWEASLKKSKRSQ